MFITWEMKYGGLFGFLVFLGSGVKSGVGELYGGGNLRIGIIARLETPGALKMVRRVMNLLRG